jgi:hypothetical protein
MKNLQFLTDAIVSPEELSCVKGGKRLSPLQTTEAGAELLAQISSKTVLYNGKVYTLSTNLARKVTMVTCDVKDTCVEW